MLSELPEQVHSHRLLIRVAKPGDGMALNEAIVESCDQLKPWLSWVTPLPSVQESEHTCRMAYGRYLLNEDLMALFYLRESGTLVGGGGLHRIDWKLRHFEVGYWGRTKYGGRGLITEAVEALALCALQDMGAKRVYLTTDAKNERSWRLAERANFQLEGILRSERLNLEGQLRDTRMYSRVAV